VVDRQQVYRTISREEMLHLFEFGDDENSDTLIDIGQQYRQADTRNISSQTANSLKQNASRSHGSCASDKVMESLLGKHRQRWGYYFIFYIKRTNNFLASILFGCLPSTLEYGTRI